MTKKIALITGANKSIGFEVARGLGAQGVTVLVGARSPERGEAAVKTLRGENIDAVFVQLDVTDADSIAAATARVEAEYGRLDILVNNAGVAMVEGASMTTSENTLDAYRQVYELNVLGVAAVTSSLLPLLKRAEAARIVNVTSELGSHALMLDEKGPFWAFQGGPYGTSKAALNMLTISFAKELWDTPIKVNAVSPGYCATDFNNHSGYRTAAEGARPIVAAALLDADGPTAAYWGEETQFHNADGHIPW
ncbi:MAG TPA: SDR family oxidoreductase [Stackebrandtia sp.]|jgi:NAD(P)-dependent dehydrogenase (short-subunit alcohol dehydrogenase family)|uniref:SDR family oxidoreductase n=1 Tax=Stackebrandtia sp. TaxID=2023065 RepID=UPI002D3024D2|nr:SDR family oxidoreductase [Stackebrandtia sp.]HZE41066.1 SDR family oxidoreductase [Stackebrandtia sp.]